MSSSFVRLLSGLRCRRARRRLRLFFSFAGAKTDSPAPSANAAVAPTSPAPRPTTRPSPPTTARPATRSTASSSSRSSSATAATTAPGWPHPSPRSSASTATPTSRRASSRRRTPRSTRTGRRSSPTSSRRRRSPRRRSASSAAGSAASCSRRMTFGLHLAATMPRLAITEGEAARRRCLPRRCARRRAEPDRRSQAPTTATRGRAVMEAKGCPSCHAFTGVAPLAGANNLEGPEGPRVRRRARARLPDDPQADERHQRRYLDREPEGDEGRHGDARARALTEAEIKDARRLHPHDQACAAARAQDRPSGCRS